MIQATQHSTTQFTNTESAMLGAILLGVLAGKSNRHIANDAQQEVAEKIYCDDGSVLAFEDFEEQEGPQIREVTCTAARDLTTKFKNGELDHPIIRSIEPKRVEKILSTLAIIA